MGTNAVCPNPLYGLHDEYYGCTECACCTLKESGSFAGTSSDIKGFEACIGSSADGKKAVAKIGDKTAAIV